MFNSQHFLFNSYTNLFFLFILDKQPHNFPTGIQLGKYLASHAEHRTKFWGNHGGGATINRLAKQKFAGVHRDVIDPLNFTGASRQQKHARQADLHLPRDERNPDSRVGGPRINIHARQADQHLPHD